MDPIWIILIAAWICIFLPAHATRRRKRRHRNRQKNKEGVTSMIPADFISQYIGKTVTIYAEGAWAGSQAEIIEVKDNWIKAKYKNQEMLINGDMVTSITYTNKIK